MRGLAYRRIVKHIAKNKARVIKLKKEEKKNNVKYR